MDDLDGLDQSDLDEDEGSENLDDMNDVRLNGAF